MTIMQRQPQQEGPPAQDPTATPIINSPYEEPQWHWSLGNDGVAQLPLLRGRRESRGINPVPQAKGGSRQLSMDEQTDELALVNNLRNLVSTWRRQNYPGVTTATRQLLDHWNSDDQTEPRLFFAQREAIETLIYLFEAARNNSQPWNDLREVNSTYNENMRRIAVKMATGTGKTAVMALVIIWQAVNHHQNPSDRRFTNRFAVITPGLTVRDRDQRDLIPNGEKNIYQSWKLIPNRSSYRTAVENARVSITNFHTLQLKEMTWGQPNTRARRIARMEVPTENSREMIKRALREMDTRGPIMVLNDEGHHCHNTNPLLVKTQKEEQKTADLWFKGLLEIQKANRLHSVIDFSATPMFIANQGTRTSDKIFPWTVSDFPITDAIESGMVKIPRVPVEDDTRGEGNPIYRNLYAHSAGKTKQKREELTSPLDQGLRTMYQEYMETSRAWDGARTPPVFIIVANDIPNAQAIFEHVAGYRPRKTGPGLPGSSRSSPTSTP